jgi:hypothetical protein
MASTLLQRQWEFSAMVMRLISKAYALGYTVSLGDAYRDPRCPYGHPLSLHKSRLAIDLNLYKDGRYITDHEGHKELHEWWAGIGGAPMIANDANHYSVDWEGMV